MNKIITSLPKNKTLIDWSKTVGMDIEVLYNDVLYKIYINRYDINSRNIFINYKEHIDYKIASKHFMDCRFGKLFGYIKTSHKYIVGDIVDIKNGKIKILEQIKIQRNQGYAVRGYRYKCFNCNGISTIQELNINDNTGCNICANRKIVKGINDISTTHPYLTKYFRNIEDAYSHSYGSSDYTWIKCPNCEHEYSRKISGFIKKGFICPCCGDGISYPNKFAFNLLKQLNLNFISEYSPEWIKPRRYDFYFMLNNKRYVLEMDGGLGHGNKDNNMNGQTKEESKFIDDKKDEQARLHGIEIIRINCNYGYNDRFIYIKDKIITNIKLNKLFDLSKIDWLKIEEFCLSSRVKEACDLWNSGIHSTKEIGEIMKLSYATIGRYLKKGTVVKWCTTYDESEQREKGLIKGRDKGIPIICINDNKIYHSAKNAYELIGVNRTGITNCCRGKSNFAGRDKILKQPLFWMYVEDYNMYIKNKEISVSTWDEIHIYLYNKYSSNETIN